MANRYKGQHQNRMWQSVAMPTEALRRPSHPHRLNMINLSIEVNDMLSLWFGNLDKIALERNPRDDGARMTFELCRARHLNFRRCSKST